MKIKGLQGLAAAAALAVAAVAGADSAVVQAGTLASSAGSVQVERNGQSTALPAGSEINAGDMIHVGGSSSAQLKTADSAVFELGSDTDFKIDSYSNPANAPGTAKYTLGKGVMRTVTGMIGKHKGDNYMVTAPEADIRVHGTDYSAQEGGGLLVIVYAGAVTVSNDTGQIEVTAGQYVFVGSRKGPLHWKNLDDINIEINIPIIIRLPPIPVSPS